MAKKGKPDVGTEVVLARADLLLQDIRNLGGNVASIEAEYNREAAALAAGYEEKLYLLRGSLSESEKGLVGLMKTHAAAIFAAGDVVNLICGSLVREAGEKVIIPRNAVADCEAQGFTDAVKIVKSIVREVIEKWPDAKLFLIGAVRKPVTEYSYELKLAAAGKAAKGDA